MNISQRLISCCVPFVLLLGVSQLAAQVRGPAVQRDRAEPPPGVVEGDSALTKAAKWPLRMGTQIFEKATRKDDVTEGDPFVDQGADDQRRLAYEFVPQSAAKAGLFQVQSQPSFPGQLPQQSYPWPQPVDSQTIVAGPVSSANEIKQKGGSRIVEAVRKANAKMAARLGTNPSASRIAGQGSSLTGGQYSTSADAATVSNDIVKKYMRRLAEEGTATGEFINQVADNSVGQMQAAASGMAAGATDYATGVMARAQATASGAVAKVAGNVPNANQPQGAATLSAGTVTTPAYIQPTTQYVPNVPPARTTPPAQSSPAAGFVPAANPQPPTIPQPPYLTSGAVPNQTSVAPTPAAGSTTTSVDRGSSFPAAAVAPVGVSAASGNIAPAADPPSNAAPSSRVVTHVQAPKPKMPSSVPPPSRTPSGVGTLDEATKVLAVVGDQTILAGDVLTQINQMLEPYRSQMTDEQYREQSGQLIRRSLPRLVENKLVALDFLRTVPPDKMPELEAKVFEYFRDHDLQEMQEKLGATSTADLDAKLREMGSSLAKQQKLFFDKFLGTEAVRRNVNIDAEITHEELLEYYRAHQDEFANVARARWQRLSLEISKYDSSDDAYNALVALGNEVKQGTSFVEVAKRSSHGPRASDGGQYDWTTKGSLRSKVIDELIFTLQPGEFSRIVEDEGSFHIVTVLEREDAGIDSFAKAQGEITKMIKEERFQAGAKKYLSRLRSETYVWTIYDDQPPANEQTAQQPNASSWNR